MRNANSLRSLRPLRSPVDPLCGSTPSRGRPLKKLPAAQSDLIPLRQIAEARHLLAVDLEDGGDLAGRQSFAPLVLAPDAEEAPGRVGLLAVAGDLLLGLQAVEGGELGRPGKRVWRRGDLEESGQRPEALDRPVQHVS